MGSFKGVKWGEKYAPFYKKFGGGTEKGVYAICPIGRGWGHAIGSTELNHEASYHRTGCSMLTSSLYKLTNQGI